MAASIGEAVNDDQEWPSLNRRQDEWELLEQEDETDDNKETGSGLPGLKVEDAHSFEVIVEADALPPPISSPAGSRRLRHCNSSPSLSTNPLPDEAEAETTAFQSPLRSLASILGAVTEDEEESSFAMVSGPPSVWTSPTTGGLNFREAILSSSGLAGELSLPVDNNEALSSARNTTTVHSSPRRNNHENGGGGDKKSALRKFQPRFVVVPTPPRMPRRCSLSTGDLPSLLVLDEHGDANEFYQQKSMATSSYSVGRKQRPDEAKRRTLIIQKKERQRQGNQQ